MSEYLVLIYEREAEWENGGPELFGEMYAKHQEFGAKHASSLRAATHCSRPRDSIRTDMSGDATVTDGPFAETKEALAGYYLIEAADLDEALAIAKAVPAPSAASRSAPSGPSTEPAVAVDAAVSAAVDDAHRREWAFVLAATVRITADIDEAEECVQHAYATALTSWSHSGIPDRPGAWLTTVARRRAIDLGRRRQALHRSLPLLVERWSDTEPSVQGHEGVRDDRLRLIFTCCHPALSRPAQVALTLRLVCGSRPLRSPGLPRERVHHGGAHYTGQEEDRPGAHRLRTPPVSERMARVDAVLGVVHLVFTTGHTAPSGVTSSDPT